MIKTRFSKYQDLEMIYTYKGITDKVKIYDITYDKVGFPLFLTYYNGQWIRKSAKYFRPIGEDYCD